MKHRQMWITGEWGASSWTHYKAYDLSINSNSSQFAASIQKTQEIKLFSWGIVHFGISANAIHVAPLQYVSLWYFIIAIDIVSPKHGFQWPKFSDVGLSIIGQIPRSKTVWKSYKISFQLQTAHRVHAVERRMGIDGRIPGERNQRDIGGWWWPHVLKSHSGIDKSMYRQTYLLTIVGLQIRNCFCQRFRSVCLVT